MLASDLIKRIEDYILIHGNDEVEFRIDTGGDDEDREDATFVKIHDGYNAGNDGKTERVCELILKIED